MCRLIESIKVIDGKFENIYFHNRRLNNARSALWNRRNEVDISDKVIIPSQFNKGLYKCRILYSAEIEKIEFVPYQFPLIRSLKLITDDEIDYPYKYADRGRIASWFEKRGLCDDILIIKNGFVTDTSFCNTVFFDGEKYYTPATPLLNGTKRRQLLAQKKIVEKIINRNDLHKFQKIYLINAMIEMEDNICIDIKNVIE